MSMRPDFEALRKAAERRAAEIIADGGAAYVARVSEDVALGRQVLRRPPNAKLEAYRVAALEILDDDYDWIVQGLLGAEPCIFINRRR